MKITTMTVNFRLARLFFRRSLQVELGFERSPKEDLWGFLVQDFFYRPHAHHVTKTVTKYI